MLPPNYSTTKSFYYRTIIECNNIKMKMKSIEENETHAGHRGRSGGAAFLLAQIGSHAASKFAGRLTELTLVPAHAGILRILAATPAMTQQALATALRTLPSRLVALVDELESRGLLERRAQANDRRSYALHLTEKGRFTLQAIGRIAREHQQEMLAGLSEDEQRQLTELLQRIADRQRLIPGVHPGYANAKVTGKKRKP
jgi:DNA-binding MarR family transcriptional regulator